ncbi:MAG: hypothetical protein AAGA80_01530 [Cyanobacteria bacterium P01_F01_bin.143]
MVTSLTASGNSIKLLPRALLSFLAAYLLLANIAPTNAQRICQVIAINLNNN